ncbi:cytochrome P450 [Immersiella caudata]|uniref:Cytochrome P450 n=1 Tax=Immersiella caudata TaxID=314043 RepID=A0AA39TL66_9PEZI|nr:cytochrome P450 [Immersiella caudata]
MNGMSAIYVPLPELGSPIAVGVGFVLAICVAQLLYRFFMVRTEFRRLKAQGVPIMSHSFLLGHLPIVAQMMKSKPRDLHWGYIPQMIVDDWKAFFPDCTACPAIIYLDVWPVGPPTVYTIDPAMSTQSIQTNHQKLQKVENMLRILHPLGQNLDILTTHGPQWRVWRSRFNPAFSSKSITALVPTILEEVVVFRDILRSKIGKDGNWGDVFTLEPLTTNLTFDVIGRAALDVRLDEQNQGPGRLQKALVDQLAQGVFEANIWTLPKRLSPIRWWKIARNNKTMRDVLLPSVYSRLESSMSTDPSKSKTIVDLAVQEFLQEDLTESSKVKVDDAFIDIVLAQLKTFIFAGHDTTSTSICWTIHCLAKFPSEAVKVRAEHDAVLGTNLEEALSRIRTSPHVLNQLPYTLAFIKETLRLFPGVGPVRGGVSDFSFEVPGAVPHPTKGFMILDAVRATSHAEHIWPRANEFLPQRFLVGPNDPLHPPKNAWHPFGLGPRGCIGQELAMAEIKVVVALVARELEIDCAWKKWDTLKGTSKDVALKETVEGHRCYQSGPNTPHTKENMPVHVRFRK